MNIEIDLECTTPIYSQIALGIKMKILSGELKCGQLLPSMRKLAETLSVSLITTKHAYEYLEKKRFVTTVAGKGTYVCKLAQERMIDEQRLDVENHLRNAVVSALGSKVPLDEITELLEMLYHEEQDLLEERNENSPKSNIF